MTYKTWMISVRRGGGYVGRYWHKPVSPWMEGHRYATWRTREEARAECVRVRRWYPEASVRRVTVTITENNDGQE